VITRRACRPAALPEPPQQRGSTIQPMQLLLRLRRLSGGGGAGAQG
jgi:hypothetical protein